MGSSRGEGGEGGWVSPGVPPRVKLECKYALLAFKTLKLSEISYRAVRLRCLPILLDCELLSEKTRIINIYQGFLLAGVKFLAYITALPQWRRKDGYRFLKLERKLTLYFFSEPLIISMCPRFASLAWQSSPSHSMFEPLNYYFLSLHAG